MVLGQLPPSANSNTKPKPNPNSDLEGGNFPRGKLSGHPFEHAERFNISHFTYHLRYYIIVIINHRGNLLTFQRANIKLYYVSVQSKRTHQT